MLCTLCVQSCWNCGRKASETCSGCNVARYCGSFCQHKDWENHHLVCGKASVTSIAQQRDQRRAAITAAVTAVAASSSSSSSGPVVTSASSGAVVPPPPSSTKDIPPPEPKSAPAATTAGSQKAPTSPDATVTASSSTDVTLTSSSGSCSDVKASPTSVKSEVEKDGGKCESSR